jgi:hypothetical protein
VGQGGGVARLLELPEHLRVREDLPGVAAPQLEEPPEERWLVHPRQQEDVAGDGGLDERVADEAGPPLGVPDQGCGPRIAAEKQVLLQREAEGRPHLAEGPVGDVQHLEAARQALCQATLDEKRRRTEQHHLERPLPAGVFVPQSLDRLGPAGCLLHFVEHQDPAFAAKREARRLPLLGNPLRPSQRGLVGTGEDDRHPHPFDGLLHQGGLADLPGPGDDLDESPRLREAAGQERGVRPPVGSRLFAQDVEYFYSSY